MDVEVIARGLRNHQGSVLFALFIEPRGFPDRGELAAMRVEVPIDADQVRARFSNVPDGQALAVGVLHDEDGDKRMATGLFGMPKEGFGVSNNPRILFGPPRFEDARLVPQPGQPIIIDMKYF
ncbi:MAG TPA: DUF2141 domain-containing protein [Immundisolibacter sp.]|nr:DUF2141 domain-containing protein [Immundisolibacter sp.]